MFQIQNVNDLLAMLSKLILEYVILGIIFHISAGIVLKEFNIQLPNPSVFGWSFLCLFVRLSRRVLCKLNIIPFLKL